jgi:hypothetical protein
MKTTTQAIAGLFFLAAFNTPLFADEKDAAKPKTPTQGMAVMGDMGGMSNMSEEQMDAHVRGIQEYMLTNYDFMRQIREAKDEKEQARLKVEWSKAMKHHLNQVPKQLMMHGVPEHNAPEK